MAGDLPLVMRHWTSYLGPSRLLVPPQQILPFLRRIPAHTSTADSKCSIASNAHFHIGTRRLSTLDSHRIHAVSTAENASADRIVDMELVDEVQKSYLSYAMSVIVGRALPDVRDGLKPVHRRILYAMHDLGLHPSKPFRKSARVVGEVLGKYHPHGDSAVYNALVRLAQPFSMRTPLINGHGNFGSQDEDPAAAMRYTECRLQQATTAALLSDIDFDTVDWNDTFDGQQKEPSVLPARLPFALINGSEGIAVTVATKIPPHNIREVTAALQALIKNRNITTAELMKHIPGPDFPTGGEIVSGSGMLQAYETGRGKFRVQGKAYIEDEDTDKKRKSVSAKQSIIIKELPYQVVKSKLVEHIAKLAEGGQLDGVTGVNDESDRDGMRVVVEVKRGYDPRVILNNLYKLTNLSISYSCNLVAIVDREPRTLGLKEFLIHFLDFRCDVVSRRAKFDLDNATKRAHIVEGLVIARSNLQEVISKITLAKDSKDASDDLRNSYGLSVEQTEAIMGLALRRLTSTEDSKLKQEQAELQKQIEDLQALLGNQDAIETTVAREAGELAKSIGDERKSEIIENATIAPDEGDMIEDKPSLILFSQKGFIKRVTPEAFSAQARGGKGTRGAKLRDDDNVEDVLQVTAKQTVFLLGRDGVCHRIKAYNIPEASRTAAGTPIAQIISKHAGSTVGGTKVNYKSWKVAAIMPIASDEADDDVVFMTRHGWLKRMHISELLQARNGFRVMKFRDADDELIWVRKARKDSDLLTACTDGRVTRVPLDQFPYLSRVHKGLRAVWESPADGPVEICGFAVVPNQGVSSDSSSDEEGSPDDLAPHPGPCALFVTEQAYGKRVPLSLISCNTSRKGTKQRGIKLTEDDRLTAFHIVDEDGDLLLSTKDAQIIRFPLSSIPKLGKVARGSRVMKFKDEEDKVSSVAVIDAEAEDSSDS